VRVGRVRGNIGGDGVARISTQQLFDLLEVPQRKRTAGACRRRCASLGWTTMKVEGWTARLQGKGQRLRSGREEHAVTSGSLSIRIHNGWTTGSRTVEPLQHSVVTPCEGYNGVTQHLFYIDP
jgi:hypothetical protein